MVADLRGHLPVGSVTEGATLRNLSQPAASQQLSSLERSVGPRLFVRTPHGVDPTRPGVSSTVQWPMPWTGSSPC